MYEEKTYHFQPFIYAGLREFRSAQHRLFPLFNGKKRKFLFLTHIFSWFHFHFYSKFVSWQPLEEKKIIFDLIRIHKFLLSYHHKPFHFSFIFETIKQNARNGNENIESETFPVRTCYCLFVLLSSYYILTYP